MDYDVLKTAILHSLKSVKGTLTQDAIERIFGDTLDFKGYSADFADHDFRGFERELIKMTAGNLYKCIATNPVVFSIALSKKCVEKPTTVRDYARNTSNLYIECNKFKRELDQAVKDKVDSFYIWFSNEENRESFKRFMKFFDKIEPLFSEFVKLEKMTKDKSMSDREFLRLVPNFNKKINDTFAQSLVAIENWQDLGPIFEITYLDVVNNFRNNSKTIEQMRDVLPEEVKVEKPKTAVVSQINPKEQERLDMIKKTNDAYEEFCLDVMRDLEKQYSLSVKDMYEYFVNVKFKKFVERFQMPLSNNTSIGTAKDAYAQIQGLYNYVHKISENAYCTSVYPSEK